MSRNELIEVEKPGVGPVFFQTLKQDDLEPVIGQLQRQLRALQLERAGILKRIAVVKKTVAGLADLFGSGVIDEGLRGLLTLPSADRFRGGHSQGDASHPGLTELCRKLLREAPEPLTLRQIIRALEQRSPEALARQRTPANSLRMILRRLVGYGEAKESLTKGGLRAWTARATDRESKGNPDRRL